MDLEGHYPQNTISHCIVSNETQITFHFFQGRISAMPEIRTDLFLAISKIVNEYDQEIPQPQTADNPVAPRGRAAQPSRDTSKTN